MNTFTQDEALLRAFIRADRVPRYLALLQKRNGRAKLRAKLAHLGDLDERFARRLKGGEDARLLEMLRERGAPLECYCLSQNADLDGRVVPLTHAIRAVVGMGAGTFLSCIPGQLGYFEGEGPSWRFLLERSAGAAA